MPSKTEIFNKKKNRRTTSAISRYSSNETNENELESSSPPSKDIDIVESIIV